MIAPYSFASARFIGILSVLPAVCLALESRAAIPSAEKLLPDDTLFVLTAPDFRKVREIYEHSPRSLLWNDPAMKPFKDNFVSKWKDEFVEPLERELGVRLEDFTSLPQGQFTIALIQNGWQGKDGAAPALLLLIDTKNKSATLKTNLANVRKKWVDSDKSIRTEKIRDIEFFTLSISGDDFPRTLRKFFGDGAENEEPAEGEPKKPSRKAEIVIGQFESLLIVSTAMKAAEKVAVHLTGGSAPTLSELAAYDANHIALFRDAPIYGWVNAKLLVTIWGRPGEAKPEPEAFSPMPRLRLDKFIAASGLTALQSVAFTFHDGNDGSLFDLFLAVPEANRQGLFKILPGEPKESSPPLFIPADAVKFQRWRLDGQKTWAALQKMLNDISPTSANLINFIIDTANAGAKERDPDYDLRKNLLGNLGDDIISYEKTPRGMTPLEMSSPPSVYLIGSPNPEQLSAALKGIFVILSPQGTPTEREFLGKKIYTITIQNPALIGGLPEPGKPLTRTISYAAARSYVALTSDASLLEEFLRTSENPPKALRDTPGLAEATAKVAGAGTGLFNYENQSETMRASFDAMKKNPAAATNASTFGPFSSAFPGMSGAEKSVRGWMDFSLLPSFDRVGKYFHFTVTGTSANVDGLTVKMFAPIPPDLKK
jgi:hypothetical protein